MRSHPLFRVYVETSAVNALHKELSIGDAIATKAHLNLKGKGWFISPVVLWEILATENPEHREQLIYFAQHLFQETLLPSPEELLINFIRAGCPKVEEKYHLAATGIYANTWKDICAIKEKTIVFDSDQHKKLNTSLRKFCRGYYTFNKFDSIDVSVDEKTALAQFHIQNLINYYGIIPTAHREDSEYIKYNRVIVFYVLMILCAGASIDRQLIEGFWTSLGIEDRLRKIEYTFTELSALFHHGPIIPMALMTYVQSSRKFSRGMFFDCLHSVYSIYADLFMTNDEHFRSFRVEVENTHSIKLKLRMLDELQIVKTPRINPERISFISHT